jgi:hypothetical protein
MESVDIIIYVMLTLVLFILIGVVTWFIYDYYKYKDDQEQKLASTFTKYKEIDDVLGKDIISSSNILYKYSSNINLNTSNYINDMSISTNSKISATSNIIVENTSNFNNNLSKYFKFGTDGNGGISGYNTKLYEYTMWNTANDGKLELINETTAAAGLRLKTDVANGLKICDRSGGACYNLYVNGSNLHIKSESATGDIKWGDTDSFVKTSQYQQPVSGNPPPSGGSPPLGGGISVTEAATAAGLAADNAASAANAATLAAETATTEATAITAVATSADKTAAKTKAVDASREAYYTARIALDSFTAATTAANVAGVEAAVKTTVLGKADNAKLKGDAANLAGDNASIAASAANLTTTPP